MRVLLRNRITGLYCASSSEWAAAAQALDFTSVAQATRFALKENLPEAEIVLKFALLPDEVVVPVLPDWCDIGRRCEDQRTTAWPGVRTGEIMVPEQRLEVEG